MSSYFQDDIRESEMRSLFSLREVSGRSETDAILELEDGTELEFELKTTSDKTGSVTTARDVGLDHFHKWKHKHWLIGFYDSSDAEPDFYLYGSPQMMEAWIEEKRRYVEPDFTAAQLASKRTNMSDLFQILGKKTKYSYEDALYLQKRQYTKEQYQAKMDLDDGYSKEKMLEIYRDRVRYLIERGSTLNNPHIPGSYFNKWDTVIRDDHAINLRNFVKSHFLDKLP